MRFATASAYWPRQPASSETAGGVTVATLRKLAEAGAIDPSERVVAVITGEGLKTLDATKDGFRMAEIEPTVADFEANAERPEAAVA
jgi:threonine synthase